MTQKIGLALGMLAILTLGSGVHAETLFLAHYNGNTANSGCDADYGVGSTAATTSSGAYPSINTTTKQFGDGALNVDWWSGRSLRYATTGNFDIASSTFEFFLNTNAGFYYDEGSSKYLFDGTTRYVLNNDIAWGSSGHVDAWFSGTAGGETARLVIHIAGSRSGTPFTLTLMGAPISYSETNAFTHNAIQWDASSGALAVFTDGILRDKQSVAAWDMTGTSSIFQLGSTGSSNVGQLILDELRISSAPVYDSSMNIGEKSFDVPTQEFPVPEPISAIILGIGALMLSRKVARKQ